MYGSPAPPSAPPLRASASGTPSPVRPLSTSVAGCAPPSASYMKKGFVRKVLRYCSTLVSNSLIESAIRPASLSISGRIDLRSCGAFFLDATHDSCSWCTCRGGEGRGGTPP